MRSRGLSVLARLTLSYAAVVIMTGGVMLTVVYVFLLRYVPTNTSTPGGFIPARGDLARAFWPPAAWTLAGLVVAGLVFGHLLARWMLRPVAEIRRATSAVADGALSHRIAMGGAGDEFRDLADAFDTMLDRVQARADEQRRFAANASHELRTPLAVTRSLIDVARADPHADLPTLLDRLETVNDRAVASTEALLLLSRLDAAAIDMTPVDLSLAADEAVESLHPTLAGTAVELFLDLDAADVRGDSTLLTRLVANLVHNAIVHNLADGGQVRVRTGTVADGAFVEVENTGPVIDPVAVPRLVEPFQRTTRARDVSVAHVGAGLGLAIVASICRVHDATLTVAAPASGGLRVRAVFPPR